MDMGLSDHERRVIQEKLEKDRQQEEQKKADRKRIRTKVTVLAIIVLAVAVGGFLSTTGFFVASGPAEHDDLAKYLTSKGARMYGAFWCPHCNDQKEAFGPSWQYVDYVECDPSGADARSQLCNEKNIEGYPTWEINGQLYKGVRSLNELAQLSGYQGN